MDENLQQSFLRFCKANQFEINPKQVEIINLLESFISIKKRFFNIFQNFFYSKLTLCLKWPSGIIIRVWTFQLRIMSIESFNLKKN